jgi:ATP synthase, F1 epsilon subunit (delta in mitochondria)
MIALNIITPEGTFDTVEATSINLDTTDGQRGILPNHMPIVLMLNIGVMKVSNNDIKKVYTVHSGMFYFENNTATLLTDAIEDIESIDVDRALQAKKRAEDRLQNPTDVDVIRAEAALERALNRLSAVEKYRSILS